MLLRFLIRDGGMTKSLSFTLPFSLFCHCCVSTCSLSLTIFYCLPFCPDRAFSQFTQAKKGLPSSKIPLHPSSGSCLHCYTHICQPSPPNFSNRQIPYVYHLLRINSEITVEFSEMLLDKTFAHAGKAGDTARSCSACYQITWDLLSYLQCNCRPVGVTQEPGSAQFVCVFVCVRVYMFVYVCVQ